MEKPRGGGARRNSATTDLSLRTSVEDVDEDADEIKDSDGSEFDDLSAGSGVDLDFLTMEVLEEELHESLARNETLEQENSTLKQQLEFAMKTHRSQGKNDELSGRVKSLETLISRLKYEKSNLIQQVCSLTEESDKIQLARDQLHQQFQDIIDAHEQSFHQVQKDKTALGMKLVEILSARMKKVSGGREVMKEVRECVSDAITDSQHSHNLQQRQGQRGNSSKSNSHSKGNGSLGMYTDEGDADDVSSDCDSEGSNIHGNTGSASSKRSSYNSNKERDVLDCDDSISVFSSVSNHRQQRKTGTVHSNGNSSKKGNSNSSSIDNDNDGEGESSPYSPSAGLNAITGWFSSHVGSLADDNAEREGGDVMNDGSSVGSGQNLDQNQWGADDNADNASIDREDMEDLGPGDAVDFTSPGGSTRRNMHAALEASKKASPRMQKDGTFRITAEALAQLDLQNNCQEHLHFLNYHDNDNHGQRSGGGGGRYS